MIASEYWTAQKEERHVVLQAFGGALDSVPKEGRARAFQLMQPVLMEALLSPNLSALGYASSYLGDTESYIPHELIEALRRTLAQAPDDRRDQLQALLNELTLGR